MNPGKFKIYDFNFSFFIFVILVFMLIMSGCGTLARYKEIKIVSLKPEEVKAELKKAGSELRVGEKLTYEVYWLKIPVGRVITEVKEITEINGRPAYHLVGSARSNKWLNLLFKVDDYVESFLDKETLLSIKHTAVRNEGKYRAYLVLEYDWDNKIVKFQNLADGTNKTFPLPERAVDEFSAFYYFRLQDIVLDKPFEFVVNQGEKNWLVRVGITSLGKFNLPGVGVFDAFMAEPLPYLEEKAFDKGSAWLWLSNDGRRIPLMIKLQVDIPIVGNVLAVLQKIE